MKALVSGSIAYDFLMQTAEMTPPATVASPSSPPPSTDDATTPNSSTDDATTPNSSADDGAASPATGVFSVAYIVDEMRRCFGGCAGNIAYAFHQLGGEPLVATTVGADFSPYRDEFRRLRLSDRHIVELLDCFTAQAYIVTDRRKSQITLFHPGASARADEQDLAALADAPLAIVAPNGKDGMVAHCRTLARRGIPFLFDPGQAMALFSGDELRECVQLCDCLIVNDGEWAALQNMTAMSADALVQSAGVAIVTYGEAGSEFLGAGGESFRVGVVALGETQNPTGCGDAYRAGLMVGWLRGWSWRARLQFASVIGGVKALHPYSQGYDLSFDMAREIYAKQFGSDSEIV